MAINEWKIWQKLGLTKPKEIESKIDIDKDIDAILLFTKEISPDIKELSELFAKFKSLRKKEVLLRKSKASIKKIRGIIEQEVEVYDKILEKYEYLELEVDVNGERVKNISTVLGKTAKDANISQKWLKRIKESERWIFDW